MNKFLDGVYDISNEDYHGSQGISRSQLLHLNKSPYHFWYKTISGEDAKENPTTSMNIGTAFHGMLLEPEKFESQFLVMPNLDRRTKAGKEMYAQFMAESEGKTILTQDEYWRVYEMVEKISQHEIVATLLEGAKFEQSIFWTDKETGIQFKSRPDIWSPSMIVDLKTTANANYYSFQRSAMDYGYFLQAGMTYEACKTIGKPFEMFVILACEKEAPYVPAVYMMDNEALQFGIDQFQNLKKKLKACMDKNHWPAYEIKELSVPKYAINTITDFED